MSQQKSSQQDLTNEEKISKIIQNCGHDFHLRIAHFLEEKKWEVAISPYYSDPATNLSREVDIIATKKYPVTNRFNDQVGNFTVRLFIECKYINEVNFFWFESKNMPDAEKLIRDSNLLYGAESYFFDGQRFQPPKQHHYLIEKEVAKLWQEYKGKTQGDKSQTDPFSFPGNPGRSDSGARG